MTIGSPGDASQPVTADPGADCPSWCDGHHEGEVYGAACHGRIVAQYDQAAVALSCITYQDPAESGSSLVILDLGTPAGPAELEESDAIRLLGTLEVAGDGPAWLVGALRSALDLLDPGAGWARPR
jgi:hypothetical protein